MRTILIILVNILVQYKIKGEITVNLRIEGEKNTIFESIVSTEGKKVTTASGGTHICDGTNNNASFTSGPTVTSALDSASKLNGFTWDG
jgi:transcriptional regulator of NAD metabolism